MAKAYDTKVRPQLFLEEDLMLKEILPLLEEDRRKWALNYKALYVVKKDFSGGALRLSRMDAEDRAIPVNSNSVKRNYV
jgi:hypothetical protein